MGEPLERDLAGDGDRRRVQRLGDLGADEGGADDDPPLVRRSPGARCPGALRPTKLAPALAEVSTSTASTGRSRSSAAARVSPTAATCGLGEHHPRRARLVGGRRGRTTEDVVGADPRLVLAHMGEQRASVDVADRVKPVRAAHAQLIVDLEVAAGVDPGGLEPELGGARPPADRDQKLVTAQLLVAFEPQRHLLALAAGGGGRLAPSPHLDPAGLEPGGRPARRRTAPRPRARAQRPRPR